MFDVIVVGGGIVGAAATYEAVQRGARTLLIDAHHAGRATDAGAGIVSPETTLRDGSPHHLLAEAVAPFYPQFVAELEAAAGADVGYANCGLVVVARTDEEATMLGKYRELLVDPNAPGTVPEGVTEITPEAAREKFPPLGPVTRALWSRDAARVDGRRLNAALISASIARGLEVETANVDALVVEGGAVRGVMTAGRSIESSGVILAGGAWTATLMDSLGLTLAIAPQRGQIAHLTLEGVHTEHWAVVNPLAEHYLLAFADRVVVGATRETGSGFDARVTASGVTRVLRDALSVAPGLADATVHEIRVGLRPVAARGYPYLGPCPGVDGVFLAAGHGASGLTYGPWSGVQVADAALGLPHADLSPFAL